MEDDREGRSKNRQIVKDLENLEEQKQESEFAKLKKELTEVKTLINDFIAVLQRDRRSSPEKVNPQGNLGWGSKSGIQNNEEFSAEAALRAKGPTIHNQGNLPQPQESMFRQELTNRPPDPWMRPPDQNSRPPEMQFRYQDSYFPANRLPEPGGCQNGRNRATEWPNRVPEPLIHVHESQFHPPEPIRVEKVPFRQQESLIQSSWSQFQYRELPIRHQEPAIHQQETQFRPQEAQSWCTGPQFSLSQGYGSNSSTQSFDMYGMNSFCRSGWSQGYNSKTYHDSYHGTYLHLDAEDAYGYQRTLQEPKTRYDQDPSNPSSTAYGQSQYSRGDFPCNGGLNSFGYPTGSSHGLRNMDCGRNDAGYVDVASQEPSSIVSQTEFSSSPGKVDLELSISSSRNKVGASLEFENEAKLLDKKELDADLQAIDEGMELPQEMRVNVEAFCNLKTKEHEVSVECDAEFSVVNQKKMVSIGKSDELEVKNSDVWRKVDLVVHCGIKEAKMQDNNVGNSVDISATVSNHFSKTIELNHLEMVVVLGRKCLEEPARYKLLVMGCVFIVQGAIQWDFKKYKKKCLAVRGGNGSTTNYNIFSIFLAFQLYS